MRADGRSLGDVTRRQDELPLWVRACGLRLELQIPGEHPGEVDVHLSVPL